MQILTGIGIRLLEGLFVLGLAGSLMVLVIAAAEDVGILLRRSSEEER